MLRPALLITAALLATSTTAQAHTGVGDATGFIHGFGHPLSGIDHILAVVAVALAGCSPVQRPHHSFMQTVSNDGPNPFGGAPAVDIPDDAKAMSP